MPTGAHALIATLIDADVRTCFTNPGTSEIHVVAALDSLPEMRAVLTLFEGVATGAADGYARMSDAPAATLLHLGPGLGNGLANLHNARRAKVPLVSIVGDHAQHHVRYDAPLQSDIETIARNVAGWVRTSSGTDLAGDTVQAIAAAIGPPAEVATLSVPAVVLWREGAEPAAWPGRAAPVPAPGEMIEEAARTLRSGGRVGMLLGGGTLRGRGLVAAARVASATGAKLLAERGAPRLERGAGLPVVERVAYWPELASAQLAGLEHLILADASPPVSWFAYPDQESWLVPPGCRVHVLSLPAADAVASLEALAEALGAGEAKPAVQSSLRPPPPAGALTADKACQAIGAIVPEGAIVSDEAITSAAALPASTAGAPRHDWLTLTGGAIGQGLPVAVGAAIACPGRPVLALEADGSALYTIQSLWTMAREQLDVSVVIFNNRGYAILDAELGRLDVRSAGPASRSLIELGDPRLDFVALGERFGVPSRRVDTGEALTAALREALSDPGPHLIEAIIPPVSSPAGRE